MNTTYAGAFESASIGSTYSSVLESVGNRFSMNIIKNAYTSVFESVSISNTYSSVLESAGIGLQLI